MHFRAYNQGGGRGGAAKFLDTPREMGST